MTDTLARTFADFAAGVVAADVPADVRKAGRLHILDTIGVCIAGASPAEESGRAIRTRESAGSFLPIATHRGATAALCI